MTQRYDWSAWDSDVPGAIFDNFDDYRTDDVCPDINSISGTPKAFDYNALDLIARDKFRFIYYPPKSPYDESLPHVEPRIESVNIVPTILVEVFMRGKQSNA